MTKKKNTSPMKKLLPAIGMLAISATMLGTSTYAWFTMNKEVTVTGMEVRTKVGANLLITEDSYDPSVTTDNQDAKYRKDIAQIRQCLLEPSSTVDGINYWYTVDAAANGAKLSGAEWKPYNEGSGTSADNNVAGKLKYDPNFNIAYAIGSSGTVNPFIMNGSGTDGAAYGYIDYNFYIKATSDKAGQYINLTNCNLKYKDSTTLTTSGAVPEVDRAWRVAVFSDVATQNTDINTTNTLVTILKPENAVNQTSGEAVNAANGTTAVTNADQPAIIGTIASAGTTAYYRVTVRLWLEGEDTSCTSETYAKLTKDYALDLDFKLEDADTNATTKITTDPAWWGTLHSAT